MPRYADGRGNGFDMDAKVDYMRALIPAKHSA
jgi:hypothetical protein